MTQTSDLEPGRPRALKGLQKIKVRTAHEPGHPPAPKPAWLRVRSPLSPEVGRLKTVLREHALHSVCEEASCPNIGECFGHGTATFMIMGRLCTRRCPFCDVAHGRPDALDQDEPAHLAQAIAAMGLRFVVITSVDRDDLRDGGGAHFAACVAAIRARAPAVRIEALVPDFRGRVEAALEALAVAPPDIFNHNLETVPRLYKAVRPGADYEGSLALLQAFKQRHPGIPTKSGLMVGLGESRAEIEQTLKDLRAHGCEWLTIGQYLRPSLAHLAVDRYVTPQEFAEIGEIARGLGFHNVASGPLVRSSYHADRQAAGEAVGT
ncbi:MAG: lipoyl synthase [Gammaproteobacteria bacterium]|nr:lipoyl synthase [Gammaproteobacteria bacterium]